MIVFKNLSRLPVMLYCIVLMVFCQATVAQSQLRVMPLGNSITRGSMCLNGDIYDCTQGLQDSKAIGYRNRLFNLLSNSGYYVDFTGGNKYGYTIMSDPDNAGFSGIKDQHLADIVQSGTTSSPWGQVTPGPYLDYYPADIVLLEIGTNDVLALEHNDVSNVSRLLDAIDDYEVASGGPVLVFLAKIISPANFACNSHVNTATYNSKLYTMAQNRISNGDKIVWVDMHCGAGINYYTDMVDQVHPNQTGYDKMADKWFAVIDAFNTAPVVSQIPNQTIALGGSFALINLDSYVSDAEDSPQDMIWSVSPSNSVNFTVTIDENRRATVTPKDSQWSGYEDIVFVAMDRGKVVSGLQKTDQCITRFTVDWFPEIIGQQDLTISEGQSLNITLDKLIIADPENAPPGLYVVVSPGSNYSVNGTTITPQPDFFGQLSVPVKVVDAGNESNTYPLLVDVVRVNFPPVITSTPVLIAYTNGLYQYAVTASDPDTEDVLFYSAPQKPAWMQINGSTGLLSGIPARGDEGFHDVTVQVTDGNSVDDQSFTVEVILQNQAPVITTLPEITAKAGETYTYGILATDADNDPLFYFNPALPEWLEFIAAAQVAIGIPSNSDTGENLVILGVTDQIDTTYQAFIIDVSFTSGFQETGIDLNQLIYPNPAHDLLVIDLAHHYNPGEGVSFQLFDMTGKEVIQRELTDPVTEISLLSHGLSVGIYTYQLGFQSVENRIIAGRIIIR